MIIYIDENMPHHLAEGLHLLQLPENIKLRESIEVKSLKKEFGVGVKDEDWIPKVGEEGSCVITQDVNIQRTRHQRELFRQHGVGIFFVRANTKNGLKYWDFVKLMIKCWDQITREASRSEKPFAFRITAQGKVEPWS